MIGLIPIFRRLLLNTICLPIFNLQFWWLGAMEPPVPIPNTEVKRGSGDDTSYEGK